MRIHFFKAPFYFAFIWFRVQDSGFNGEGCGFRCIFIWAMPEGRTFASLSTLAENFFKNQKTVQYSEKFFHFWEICSLY